MMLKLLLHLPYYSYPLNTSFVLLENSGNLCHNVKSINSLPVDAIKICNNQCLSSNISYISLYEDKVAFYNQQDKEYCHIIPMRVTEGSVSIFINNMNMSTNQYHNNIIIHDNGIISYYLINNWIFYCLFDSCKSYIKSPITTVTLHIPHPNRYLSVNTTLYEYHYNYYTTLWSTTTLIIVLCFSIFILILCCLCLCFYYQLFPYSKRNYWICIACNATGSLQVAAKKYKGIYISNDYGFEWILSNALDDNYSCLFMSNDGNLIIACVKDGFMYKSVNQGFLWKTIKNRGHWVDICGISYLKHKHFDSKLKAFDSQEIVGAKQLSSSENIGVEFRDNKYLDLDSENNPEKTSTFVIKLNQMNKSSNESKIELNSYELNKDYKDDIDFGIKSEKMNLSSVTTVTEVIEEVEYLLYAIENPGYVYKSITSGETWNIIQSLSYSTYSSIDMNSDGTIIIISIYNGNLLISYDSGNSWINIMHIDYWKSVTMNKNGNIIIAVVENGGVYYSHDSGKTFQLSSVHIDSWVAVDCCDDGKYVVAITAGDGHSNGYIAVSNDYGKTWHTSEENAQYTDIAIDRNGKRYCATRVSEFIMQGILEDDEDENNEVLLTSLEKVDYLNYNQQYYEKV